MNIEALFETERRPLWGLCYRLTGSAADADEVVQESFVRLLERPPADRDRPIGPWLRTVALNLARDRLRRRQTSYVGAFVPEPVATSELEAATTPADARLSTKESATWAFLMALEHLTALQRAVLVLRDVYDLSTRETAVALDVGESHVKVLLHRARRKLEAAIVLPPPDADARALEAMTRFFMALGAGDADGMAALLRDEIVFVSDGAGEVFAARVPIHGIERVVKFHLRTRQASLPAVGIVSTNFATSLVYRYDEWKPGVPERGVIQVETHEDGRIARVLVVCAPSKLARYSGDCALLIRAGT